MIKAVLMDLDDTLVISQTSEMFPAYLKDLGIFCKELGEPAAISGLIMQAYLAALNEYDPSRPLFERFNAHFAKGLQSQHDGYSALFDRYYREAYGKLVQQYVTPQVGAAELVRWLIDHGYRVVVATNPGLPRAAIINRLEQGGLSPDLHPFSLITTLEGMHFGKPQPEYYEEILIKLDIEASEALMIGDDWENDMAPALAAGLGTYWLTDQGAASPDRAVQIDGHGSFAEFGARVRAGWLATLRPHNAGHRMLIHRLAAFPAGVSAAIEGLSREVLECVPGHHEWSARDIICHLRDHDAEEDLIRLKKIQTEERPFISGNYDPWSHAHVYSDTDVHQALTEFIHYRGEMVRWLASLPEEVWTRPARHAIFGPTTFEEMVRFATEHDRTHLRQMRDAIAHAVTVCGTGAV